ncbi:MAG: aminodeoxychorismate synthase component I [Bacteroidales bacterium]
MEILGRSCIAEAMNCYAGRAEPFFFLIDYEVKRGVVLPLVLMKDEEISCNIGGIEIGREIVSVSECSTMRVKPVSLSEYSKGFENVKRNINMGNSYLLNLTYKTCIGGEIDMRGIYLHSTAPYKFLWPERFVFFSPETFVRIDDGRIFSFPMKGTIDASLPNAEEMLMNDYKELCEHNTIADLIRNDLSVMATDVTVDRFRYIEEIKTSSGSLLQSSSQISGRLPVDWQCRIGDIICSMLPAGSISGAPKDKTLQIIRESETSPRGYYTGVMGVFDGNTVDSCVVIRYIEKGEDGVFYYRSGGGITAMSCMEDEYNEMIAKVYVPIV